jgi:NitT/TauT family transport system permease protein
MTTPATDTSLEQGARSDEGGASRRHGSTPIRAHRRRPAVGPFITPLVLLLGWQLLSMYSFVVPDPVGTVRALVENLGTQQFLAAVGKTGKDALIAFAMSCVVGISLGALIGLWRPFGRIVEPGLLMLNGIPKIAVYPILLLMFGLGSSSQVAMAFIFGVFPIVINFAGGLATVAPIYRRVARSLEMGRLTRLLKIEIPAALPSLAVGLRIAFSLSLVGVVFAEIISSKSGLGQLIVAKNTLGLYDQMGAAVLLLIAAAVAGSMVLWAIERRVSRHL